MQLSRHSFWHMHAVCCLGMCRGHAHGEKEGVAAADHSIFVWRRIACRCCRHPCHLRVCRTIGTNGAWCAGVCYEVCGLVCGTLSTVPWGDGLAAWQSRSPSLEQCRAAAHPRARRLPPRVLTRTRPPKTMRALLVAVCGFWERKSSAPKGGVKTGQCTFNKVFKCHKLPYTPPLLNMV